MPPCSSSPGTRQCCASNEATASNGSGRWAGSYNSERKEHFSLIRGAVVARAGSKSSLCLLAVWSQTQTRSQEARGRRGKLKSQFSGQRTGKKPPRRGKGQGEDRKEGSQESNPIKLCMNSWLISELSMRGSDPEEILGDEPLDRWPRRSQTG